MHVAYNGPSAFIHSIRDTVLGCPVEVAEFSDPDEPLRILYAITATTATSAMQIVPKTPPTTAAEPLSELPLAVESLPVDLPVAAASLT
eukprot:m.44636 g.44636  ORF g.44636 m.44636 type:complete len:89 (+) comp11719_c0_seq3:210-476(+)